MLLVFRFETFLVVLVANVCKPALKLTKTGKSFFVGEIGNNPGCQIFKLKIPIWALQYLMLVYYMAIWFI
jgi:hypothetical protein